VAAVLNLDTAALFLTPIALFLALVFRLRHEGNGAAELPSMHLGIGAVATAAATALILALHNAAVPVLGVGIAAAASRRVRPRIEAPVLAGLFLVTVALGTLGRRWDGPANLLTDLNAPATAAFAAASSVLVNTRQSSPGGPTTMRS
jgi:hypothetical protein